MRRLPWLLFTALSLVGLTIGFWTTRERIRLFPRALPSAHPAAPRDIAAVWASDFEGNRVFAVNRAGERVWEQHMASPPIPPRSHNVRVEYVTVAPNGNPIVSDGEGMMVQELDRTTHAVVWQYGVRGVQGHLPGFLHQPDKAYKLNNHEVLINDGNNRRVIIVNLRTNEIVWQYGETIRMGSAPGLLRGNTHAVPAGGGTTILITDTLEKKLLLVDRATKNLLWEWTKPGARWLQHAFPTPDGTFVLEDRQAGEVFEVASNGEILWTIRELADGSRLRYPTDAIKLDNGNVLIAEAGRNRLIEVSPRTRDVVWQYPPAPRLRGAGGGGKPSREASAGYPTTIAVEYAR